MSATPQESGTDKREIGRLMICDYLEDRHGGTFAWHDQAWQTYADDADWQSARGEYPSTLEHLSVWLRCDALSAVNDLPLFARVSLQRLFSRTDWAVIAQEIIDELSETNSPD